MKALILVGGKATRLLPLTVNTPKSLLPVLNIPFLEYAIRELNRHGIKDVILAQGHLSRQIEERLGNGSKLGVNIVSVVEESPLGTAGAIKNAEAYLDDTFLVLNGDVFHTLDFGAMLRYHRQKKAKATIALTAVDDPTSYGLVETKPSGRVNRFLEKPKPNEITTNMINAGTYVLEREVLDLITPGKPVSIEREVFPAMLTNDQAVYSYPSTAYWIDIGTPQKYLQLHRDLLSGRVNQSVFTGHEEIIIGQGSNISLEAKIHGPVIIGERCRVASSASVVGPAVIGADCEIERRCHIQDSVMWHGVQLKQAASVKSSIVADNCVLEKGCSVEESVLSDHVTIGRKYRLKNGKIEPGTSLDDSSNTR